MYKFKVFLGVFVFLTFFAASGSQALAASNCKIFTDVSLYENRCSAIGYVYDRNILVGNGTMFLPDQTLTRSQALVAVLRAFYPNGKFAPGESPLIDGSTVGFKDAPAGTQSWWYYAGKFGRENGIVQGYDNGNFGPGDNVNRSQFFKMFLNTSPYKSQIDNLVYNTATDLYPDVSSSSWFAKFFAFIRQRSALLGQLNTCLTGACPLRAITRAEVAQFIYNYKNYYNTDVGALTPSTPVKPTLLSPTFNQNLYYDYTKGSASTNITFTWSANSSASYYDFYTRSSNGTYGSPWKANSTSFTYNYAILPATMASQKTMTYYWKVRMYDANNNFVDSDESMFNFKDPGNALSAPVLTSPEAGYTVTGTNCDGNNLVFSWNAVPNATSYTLYFGNTSMNSGFSINTDSYSNGTYTWYVRAFDAANNYVDSAPRAVYIQQSACSSLTAPVLNLPLSGSTYDTSATSRAVTFQWTGTGASYYRFKMRINGSTAYFEDKIVNNGTSYTYTFENVGPSYNNLIYYWTVVAYDNNGKSLNAAQEKWIKFVPAVTLGTPDLVSPFSGVIYIHANPQLTVTWAPTAAAVRYDVMVRFGGKATYDVYPQNYASNSNMSFTIPAGDFPALTQNYVHYWKIRAYDSKGNWNESGARAVNVNK